MEQKGKSDRPEWMRKMAARAAKRWWSALNIITKFIMGAMTAKLFHVEITGKRRDTETVMRRLEGAIGKVPLLVTR